MTVFIGGAWPYANGSLHLGHIASLLPGDIIARFHRQKGEEVLYVSGSDCNGTPITIRAKQEGKTVTEIADYYHQEFNSCFHKLGFSYDCYSRTDHSTHHEVVQDLFLQLFQNGYLVEKVVDQVFCPHCDQFLPDRYVEGVCPTCGEKARGDQCDNCSAILDPIDLLDKKCKLCDHTPLVKSTMHLFLRLSSFQLELEQYLKANCKNWRENAVHLTARFLKEGLHDRAATRDLPIGVPVPITGFEGKKVYVWIEAVSGYLSASKEWGEKNNKDWGKFWTDHVKTYYIHGKDNIPFHSIIWPAILKGARKQGVPKYIISSEYLTVETKKLSTSRNWAVWVPDILKNYHPDSIRYFLTKNAPEKRDTDFSWQEFIYSHNSDLLGSFGNFVHRTLKFVEKEFGSIPPSYRISSEIKEVVSDTYIKVGNFIEKGECKKALETAFTLVHFGNKYFDSNEPWKVIKEDKRLAGEILYQCIYLIVNLSQILHPFLPFSTVDVRKQLGIPLQMEWKPTKSSITICLTDIHPIFKRIDASEIEKERSKLGIQ